MNPQQRVPMPGQGYQHFGQFYQGQGYPQHEGQHWEAWQPPPYDLNKPPSQLNLEIIPTQLQFKEHEISNTPTQQTRPKIGQQFVHNPYGYYGRPPEYYEQPHPTSTTGYQQDIAALNQSNIQELYHTIQVMVILTFLVNKVHISIQTMENNTPILH